MCIRDSHNINPNYYIELIRNIRKIMGMKTLRKDYYKFKDVSKTLSSSMGSKKKKKSKRKSKKISR